MDNLKNKIEKYAKVVGKEVANVTFVNGDGTTFDAFYKSEKLAKELGYNTGSMCRDMPIALAKDVSYIAKWTNIYPEDYPRIEGVLISLDFRDENEVAIVEFE